MIPVRPTDQNEPSKHEIAPPPPPALSNKSAQTDFSLLAPNFKRISVSTSMSPRVAEPPPQSHARLDELRDQYETELSGMRGEYDRNVADLREKYDRLERYAKKLKGMYRKVMKESTTDLEAQLDRMLSSERDRLESIDDVVQRLEENNVQLAENLQVHERHDKKMKEMVKKEAGKVKELKRQLVKEGGK